MGGESPQLVRRWRLTRRGRVVFGSLVVLLLFFIGSLAGSLACRACIAL